jgi:hypothetical protein
VNSRTTRRFRRAFAQLPDEVKERAREAYRLFRDNPYHPALRSKWVHRRVNTMLGLFVPALVTPLELLGGRDETAAE